MISKLTTKRVFDLSVIVCASPVWLPVLALLGCAAWIAIGRPVLFRQLRPGLDGKLFVLVKFRTLTNECDEAGRLLPDDQRLTGFGRWLRSLSLDELPEILNVLSGDMSLVGPRPLLPEYLPLYSPAQNRRHSVAPGLTGWAQINGRNSVSWEERFQLDLWYVENQNLWLDIRILCRTLWTVLSRQGISAPGEATMRPFEGSQHTRD